MAGQKKKNNWQEGKLQQRCKLSLSPLNKKQMLVL
jgi:hypothetical protein